MRLLRAVACGGGWVCEGGCEEVCVMSAPTEPAPEVPVTQKREFWALMGYVVALGVFGTFAGLVFIRAATLTTLLKQDLHQHPVRIAESSEQGDGPEP
jgi:hypothetical protein